MKFHKSYNFLFYFVCNLLKNSTKKIILFVLINFHNNFVSPPALLEIFE